MIGCAMFEPEHTPVTTIQQTNGCKMSDFVVYFHLLVFKRGWVPERDGQDGGGRWKKEVDKLKLKSINEAGTEVDKAVIQWMYKKHTKIPGKETNRAYVDLSLSHVASLVKYLSLVSPNPPTFYLKHQVNSVTSTNLQSTH